MRLSIGLLLLLLPFSLLTAQVTGHWYAILEAGGQQIPLDLEITEADGTYRGGILSPSQSSLVLPLSSLTVTEDSLRFELSTVAMAYEGALRGDSVHGTFSQGGFSAPLKWSQRKPQGYAALVSKEDPATRPQDPVNFPYRRKSVTFPGGAADVTLAGELTLPEEGPPRAAIVLVSGSGPQDRNEDLGPQMNHRPFLVLSDYLTRQGYAVLRYDDRGVGQSTGSFADGTSADFAGDAAAAFRYLGDQLPDDVPVGLAGHSEGGLILPLVAQSEADIDFLVLLAAPGLPISELMAEQRRLVGQGNVPLEPVHQAIGDYIRLHPKMDDEAFRGGLTDTIIAAISGLPDAERASITDKAAFAKNFADSYGGPWMRYFFAYDPEPALRTLRMPVLAVNGELDQQVSPANLEAIDRITATAGNKQVTSVLVPGANHLLQPATTGHPSEYGEIETTIDPEVLSLIADWLNERFR